jgi:pyruvate kinase
MLRTKIVCTLGPASLDPETVRKLVGGGMNVARVNMSHGSSEQHRAMIQAVRTAEQEVGKSVAILADLQGPRIRVGLLAEPLELVPGTRLTLAPEEDARPGEIPVTAVEEIRFLNVGEANSLLGMGHPHGVIQIITRRGGGTQ